MRLFSGMAAVVFGLGGAVVSFAQLPPAPKRTGPAIPLFQPTVPTTPNRPVVNVVDPLKLQAGVNNVPGTMVYVPPRYVGSPNRPYAVYNYYQTPNQGLYGATPGGYIGVPPATGQFYAFLGGVASSNPFQSSNFAQNTWGTFSGNGPNNQPWNMPKAYNFSTPQYPMMNWQGPVVGTSPAPPGWQNAPALPGVNVAPR